MKNKIVALGLAFATLTWAAPMIGQAATTEELQAQITALLAQISALQSQLQTPSTTSACFTMQLKVGSTGSEVTALQNALKGDSSVYPEGLVTGYFGSLTEKAVKAFQTKYGIDAVGQVGPVTRAKLNALFCTTSATPTPTATPVSGPLTVTVASDSPASANIQRGSANNVVAKFTFTAGSTAVNVTGLTLKSYGTVAATGVTDLTAVKLFDENGVQLGNDRAQTGNQVNFVIVPALVIPANGSRTISVTTTVAAGATVMANVRYGIESATGIVGATFGGTYPVVANSFMIVPAGQLGSLSVSKFGSLPKTNVKIGEKDIVLQRFNVSAGSNEDVAVNQVTLIGDSETVLDGVQNTISDSDISNLRLRKVGDSTVLATGVMSNKKVTFSIANPISLTKGASVNLEVVGDIVDGNSRVIALEVAAGGVIARGAISGTNVTSLGTVNEATGVTIGNETLTVSMSANHPQGANSYIIKTTNKKDLAKFDVRASGGDVIINTIDLLFNVTDNDGANDTLNTTTYLSGVGIYDGDALISDLLDVKQETAKEFSLNYTIPANTTKTLTVKGITNTIVIGNLSGATDYASLVTTWDYGTGYGLSSGATVTYGTGIDDGVGDVPTTAITVYPTGTATFVADSVKTPYSQGLLSPVNNVIVAALKVYAQREDQKLTKLVIDGGTDDDAGYGIDTLDMANVSSLTLYADDGITALSDAVAPSGTAVTFDSTNIFSDIIFTKAVYKTLLIKANITGNDLANPLTFAVSDTAGDFTTTGMDSGNDFTSAAAYTNLNVPGTPYAGGEYYIDKSIAEMKKASTSPSGSISRGTASITGIWDVVNGSSDLGAINLDVIKFTSKTGLPAAVTGAVETTVDDLFKLYDGDGNLLVSAAGDGDDAVAVGAGVVTFTKANMLTINTGEPKQLKLVVDTTSTTYWPSNTQIQWSVELVGDATFQDAASATAKLGYAGATWSIPAVANTVQLP
ncbi:MAG TPA: peptidoglycan-binding domain-containing protein [Candidatus Paceibacterota bacterium]|nr:peptidoglycan-binding domain-containing protein [Candidatus Paceibacterota bacterium]